MRVALVEKQKWSREDADSLINMRNAGLSVKHIATELGRDENAVRCRLHAYRKSVRGEGVEALAPNFELKLLMQREALDYRKLMHGSNVCASIAHLEDLKKAHQPGVGEHRIGQDRSVPLRLTYSSPGSFMGSSAAMCADNAGRGY